MDLFPYIEYSQIAEGTLGAELLSLVLLRTSTIMYTTAYLLILSTRASIAGPQHFGRLHELPHT
jgi:hypothetical protein